MTHADSTKLNILYVHGFGSRVDPSGEKQVTLRDIGNVTAVAPDYTLSLPQVMEQIADYLPGVDLVIGTSMGGFLASRISEATGKPFVAINPVLQPQRLFRARLGSHVDSQGRPFTLTEQAVATYPEFHLSDLGMVLLDMGDELLDSRATRTTLGDKMRVHTFPGGSHRFSHLTEALPLIVSFYEKLRVS